MNFIPLCRAKKIKFMTFSKKINPNEHILTENLKVMMNQEEFDNPSAYYHFKNFNKNFYIYNSINILHMNINSHTCHFDEFHTLHITKYIRKKKL